MKYLCLGYLRPEALDTLPKEERDRILAACGPILASMYREGRVVADFGLQNETKVLRRSKGTILITDGPFIETTELLGSVFVIDADNLEDAIRVASRHPAVQIAEAEALGWRLEVRAVHYSKND